MTRTLEQSREIQRLVFALGGRWCSLHSEVINLDDDDICLFYDHELSWGGSGYLNAIAIPEYTFEGLSNLLNSRLAALQPSTVTGGNLGPLRIRREAVIWK